MKQQQLDQVDSQITALQDVPTVNLRIWDLAWPAIVSNLLFAVIGIISIKIIKI